MATTSEEVWRLLGELAEAQKATERLLKEQSQAADRRFQETDRLLKRQNQQLNEQLGKLGNRLGKFVEWQVRPAVVRLFQKRGIAVHEFHLAISSSFSTMPSFNLRVGDEVRHSRENGNPCARTLFISGFPPAQE